MRWKIWTAAMASLFPVSANAEWLRAESDHFIIYSDDRRTSLDEFATNLERFDLAVRAVRSMNDPALPSGAKVTLFVMPTLGMVQELAGSSAVYGFYIPRATGSVSFVPKKTTSRSTDDLSAEEVFFHEYSHHLLYQTLEGRVPRWLSEGFAEFYASPKFEKDGTVTLGQSPAYRSWSIFQAFQMPIDKMLADDLRDVPGKYIHSLYGRGWALTHMLTFEPSRAGQLSRYLTDLRDGVEPVKAATDAFGDLKKLDSDITKYADRGKLMTLRVPPARIKVGTIRIEPMGPAAGDVIPLMAQSQRGVNEKTAPDVAAKLRRVAAKYPDDPLLLQALAEAELDDGKAEAALAATDRLLAQKPGNIDAINMAARAHLALAEKSKDAEIHRKAARELAIRANKIAPEDPEPLINYYDSFRGGKEAVPAAAVKGIHYALILAPHAEDLRMTSIRLHLANNELAEARRELYPLAYNPHSPEFAEKAQEALDAIDRKDGKGAERLLDEGVAAAKEARKKREEGEKIAG